MRWVCSASGLLGPAQRRGISSTSSISVEVTIPCHAWIGNSVGNSDAVGNSDVLLRQWGAPMFGNVTALEGLHVTGNGRHDDRFMDNYLAELCSGSEEGSFLRLIDFCGV